MHKLIRPVLIALAITAAVTAGGIGGAAAQPMAIPPLREEGPPPPPPGPHHIWQRGHWAWTGDHFDWVAGVYVLREHGWRGEFTPGHWGHRAGAWVWVPEHWR